MKRIAFALPAILAFVAITGKAQDRKATLDAAAAALGAADLNSIQYSGSGTSNAFGQAYAPGGAWPAFKLTSYNVAINYSTPAMRVDLERTNPDGQIRGGGGLPLLAPQKQTQLVSGNFAWNMAGQNSVPAPGAVSDRLRAIWTSPQGVIKGAMNAGNDATVAKQRGANGKMLPVITFPAAGMSLKASLGADNTVERVEWMSEDPVLGDMLTRISYSDYRDFNGVKFPTHIVQEQGGFPTLTLTVTDVHPNAEVNIAVPQNVQQAPPFAPDPVVTRKMADGVYHFSGGSLHSVAVEFKDYIVLFDPPNNDVRAHDVFEAARKEIPNKPVKYVINTHHHFDHLGGLRYDISEGAIIITQNQTKAFYEKLLTMPHTIKPDRLAQSPKKAVFETVGDSRVLTDGTRRMEIYRIQGFSHVDTMLMAYLPKEKILIEADAYNPPEANAPPAPAISPLNVTLYDNLQRLKLDVDQILPFHGRIVTMTDLRAAVGKQSASN
jgi:glyoxylase-like metal-dependent hydrolase (beta-lactamase superfamily II)